MKLAGKIKEHFLISELVISERITKVTSLESGKGN